jgi:hypothetical protein
MTITIKPNDLEVFIVQSLECGFSAIYDNIKAAIEHRDEMNTECPNDYYWVESTRLRSN